MKERERDSLLVIELLMRIKFLSNYKINDGIFPYKRQLLIGKKFQNMNLKPNSMLLY